MDEFVIIPSHKPGCSFDQSAVDAHQCCPLWAEEHPFAFNIGQGFDLWVVSAKREHVALIGEERPKLCGQFSMVLQALVHRNPLVQEERKGRGVEREVRFAIGVVHLAPNAGKAGGDLDGVAVALL